MRPCFICGLTPAPHAVTGLTEEEEAVNNAWKESFITQGFHTGHCPYPVLPTYACAAHRLTRLGRKTDYGRRWYCAHAECSSYGESFEALDGECPWCPSCGYIGDGMSSSARRGKTIWELLLEDEWLQIRSTVSESLTEVDSGLNPHVVEIMNQDSVRTVPGVGIFEDVRQAMNQAEDLGGPEGDEYVALMDEIIKEAQKRKQCFLSNLTENPQ